MIRRTTVGRFLAAAGLFGALALAAAPAVAASGGSGGMPQLNPNDP